MLMCVNCQNHFEKHIWILTSLSGSCYVSPLQKMVPPAKWQSCPSTKRFSWTEERDPIQPVEIISHLVETPCMMLKYTGLGYFAQTKSLALRLVISEKKWKSSLQLNITNVSRAFLSFRRQRSQLVVLLHQSRMWLIIPNGIQKINLVFKAPRQEKSSFQSLN